MNSIAGIDVKQIVDECGSPIYVYDKEKIATNYKRFKSAFTNHYKDVHVHFAVKANSNVHILKVMNELGAGLDCSSPGEIFLAEKAGYDSNKISYTGNYESVEDLQYAVDHGVHINLDDLSSFKRLMDVTIPERLAFRINPGIGNGSFKGIVTGGEHAKFGIPFEKALDAYKYAKEKGVKRFGIHMMTGSNNRDADYFASIVEKLMDISGNVFNKLDILPEFINIGGGFGVPYHDDEDELDIEKTGELVTGIFKDKIKTYQLGQPELHIEPGRYLVANAGYLLSQVTGIKESYKKFVGLNVGMTTLIRPALYGAYHHPSVYGKETNDETVNLCGHICENSDIFAEDITFPKAEEGDIVVFKDAGAYGFVMASNYNTRLRPAEYLIENGSLKMIRRRETFDDLLHQMTEG